MLETIAGIPAHPLFVHAAVAFLPAAAILAIITAFSRPTGIRKLRTATAVTAIIAALSTVFARSSGEAMLPMLGLSEEHPGEVSQHATYSTFALIAALALAGLAVVFWWVTRPTELAGGVITLLRIGLVIAAIATVITVVLTGHAGAELVWKGEVGV
ncbi:DUF2231 domain-containing protein [uncultured Corynebacterium sp.]|uniref:DUF2231 domain-containing protein n=1 Tax=uncultured Corynebacterium sp. TaxID=159447 RepID=UPI0025E48B4C|nr:DUF2231 domain-containing protein [uncultured Corynebacterium sp.]